MNIFTRLLLTKKNVRVNEIPKELLAYESQNIEVAKNINNVKLYYLDNGTKLLSVLKDSDNKVLEVIKILDTLDPIFHINFCNLFIKKRDEKLLGFSYPLEAAESKPNVDMEKLANIITDSRDPEDLVKILGSEKEYTGNIAKSSLVNTIFWYKIFKYLNSKKISVKNLLLRDIIPYNKSFESNYIYIINSITKLDILERTEIEEEIEIVNLCIKYFLDILNLDVYSYKFNQFLTNFRENYQKYKDETLTDMSFFENMNFLDIFYTQYKRMISEICIHEYDSAFLRCPICNGDDKILKPKKYDKIFNPFNLYLEDMQASVYNYKSESYIFLKDHSKEKDAAIKRYIDSLPWRYILSYRYLYDINTESFNIAMDTKLYDSEVIESGNVELFVNKAISDLIEGGIKCFQTFCEFIYNLGYILLSLYENGLELDVSDMFNYTEVLNCFWIIEGKKSHLIELEIKPFKLKLLDEKNQKNLDEEDYYEKYAYEIVVNLMFNLIKQQCNSRIEKNRVVSDFGVDIINLFDFRIINEYKKFLKNEKYDPNLVIECILGSFFKRWYASHFRMEFGGSENFDSDYLFSPILFNSVLEEEFDFSKLEGKFEFCNDYIQDTLLLAKIMTEEDAIIPEYISYTILNSAMKNKGYWIRKHEGINVKDAFSSYNLSKMNNKEVIHMLYVYYKYMNSNISHQDLPIEILYFDQSYSKIFIKYKVSKNPNETAKTYFFDEVLERLKHSEMYFSNIDIISIISNSPLLNKIEKLIKKTYESFTNYCEIHNAWYEEELLKCPICNKYYEFIDVDKMLATKDVIYENELYKMISYDYKKQLKLYKFVDEQTLSNRKNIYELEQQILAVLKNQIITDNTQRIIKLVKDFTTEKVIGIIISNDVNDVIDKKSVYEILVNKDSSNLTYIGIVKKLIERFENIRFIIRNLNIESKTQTLNFLKNNLFYIESEDCIYISDYEFYLDFRVINLSCSLTEIRNLDRIIKYIFFSSQKCYDLRSLEFPTIDYNYVEKMTGILEELEEYYTDIKAKYCHKHFVYYNPVDGMCPLCMKEMEDVWIQRTSEIGDKINFGGEANIYSIGRSFLIKAYKKSKVKSNNDELTEELQKVLDDEYQRKNERRRKVLETLKILYNSTKDELEDKNFIIPFPMKTVYVGKKKVFMGFLQEKVQNTISFSLFTNTKVCDELGFTTPLSLLELLISYGDGIEYLHNSKAVRSVTKDGIVLGDVSGRNVLYSKYLKKIAIIDMDSVGIKDYPAITLTDEYSDPLTVKGNAIIKDFSFESDWYSFAIICFYILTKVHPFDGGYNNSFEMSIVERKEKKISVIGKYKDKITLPNVVVNWDWMPDYLLNSFIDIFENEKRYSILDLLKKTYNELSHVEKYKFNEVKEEVEDNNVKSVANTNDKKNNILFESLAYILPNQEIQIKSSDLILENEKVYYINKSEKNLLCNDVLDFENLNYISENEIRREFDTFSFEEICVRDGVGVATMIESGVKFIGLVNNQTFTKIYKISDVNRKFAILHDTLNSRYLLVSLDNSKSYIITADKKITDYKNLYKVYTEEILNILGQQFITSKVAYVGNAIYFAQSGYIARLDLATGKQAKIDCPLATEKAAVKMFSNAIIIVTEEEILKLRLQK